MQTQIVDLKTVKISPATKDLVPKLAELHASEFVIGLHTLLSREFLTFFYNQLIISPDIDTACVLTPYGLAGFGLIIYDKSFLRRILFRNLFRFSYLFTRDAFIRHPKQLWQMRDRVFKAFHVALFGFKDPTRSKLPKECAQLEFMLANKAIKITGQPVTRTILGELQRQARLRGVTRIHTTVATGHRASIFMHSALGFKFESTCAEGSNFYLDH